MTAPLVFDSVTHVTAASRGKAALCMSHGGGYAGYVAAQMGLSAVILNDAGIGRDRAGLAGLALLERLGVPAAAVSHLTARIGDAAHGLAHGVISATNAPAAKLGIRVGQSARDALAQLTASDLAAAPAPPAEQEVRIRLDAVCRDGVDVFALDSNTLVKPEDAGHIVVTGSHGGCPGGKPENAIKYPVFAAVYSDAGGGIDNAGLTRLPALDARGIACVCVSAFSCHIGDGRSVWRDGIVSHVNQTAAAFGALIGETTAQFVARAIAARIAARKLL
jgi:hypothetical protein